MKSTKSDIATHSNPAENILLLHMNQNDYTNVASISVNLIYRPTLSTGPDVLDIPLWITL